MKAAFVALCLASVALAQVSLCLLTTMYSPCPFGMSFYDLASVLLIPSVRAG